MNNNIIKSGGFNGAINSIGPHNIEILSIIFGSLLGNASTKKLINSTNIYSGTKIQFYQQGSHLDYLFYLHCIISKLGYCNAKLPKVNTKLKNNGVIIKVIKFNT
jgi:LAGLIDADG DNA endonuclease family